MLNKIITQQQCLLEKTAASKKAVFESLSNLIGTGLTHINAQNILQSLIEREKLGSTFMGHGVALPHARIKQINNAAAALIVLENPIDFGNGEEVTIVFGLVVPEDFEEVHLKLLAEIAGMLEKDNNRQAIQSTENQKHLWKTVIELCNHENK